MIDTEHRICFLRIFYSIGEDRQMDRQLQYYEISALMEISSKGYEILPKFEESKIYRVVKYKLKLSGRWYE